MGTQKEPPFWQSTAYAPGECGTSTGFVSGSGWGEPRDLGIRAYGLTFGASIDEQMGGCQNYGPFLDPYYHTSPNT